MNYKREDVKKAPFVPLPIPEGQRLLPGLSAKESFRKVRDIVRKLW